MEAYLQVPWCCHASCLGSQNESGGFIHHKTARHVPKHVSISSRHHPNCQINPKKQRLKTNYYILIPPYSLSAGPPAPPSYLFLVHLSTQISPRVFVSPRHRKHLSPPPGLLDDANVSTLEASGAAELKGMKSYTPVNLMFMVSTGYLPGESLIHNFTASYTLK